MKNRIVKIIGSSLALVLIGSSGASADFDGPFAPSNWTFSGDATSNSLTTNQMKMVSKDGTTSALSTAKYSISVPGNTLSISFNWNYVTNDVNGSLFDMAKYSVNSVITNLNANNIPQGGSASGTVTLTNVASKDFAIIQEALDSVLGSASITISGFSSVLRYDNYLVGVAAPTLNIVDGKATCTSGTYKFASGGSADTEALIYTLLIDNQPVSRVATAEAMAVAPYMYVPVAQNLAGTASKDSATWDVSKLSNYGAQCEVSAIKSSSSLKVLSNSVTDAAKLAAIAAKKTAREVERATATAANFSAEARAARKRAAARG